MAGGAGWLRRGADEHGEVGSAGGELRETRVYEQTLRNWVNAHRQAHAGEEPPLTIRAGPAAGAGKVVRDLRLKREFPGKAAAFFATTKLCRISPVTCTGLRLDPDRSN